MTCYLRMHEVLIGIPEQTAPIDWDVAFKAWQQATTVADRERVLAAIGAEAVDIYDLPTADLRRFRGLIASDRVDQEFLHAHRHRIRDFLEAGKTLVFSGELLHPWLPGGQRFAHPAGAGAHQLVTLASPRCSTGLLLPTWDPRSSTVTTISRKVRRPW